MNCIRRWKAKCTAPHGTEDLLDVSSSPLPVASNLLFSDPLHRVLKLLALVALLERPTNAINHEHDHKHAHKGRSDPERGLKLGRSHALLHEISSVDLLLRVLFWMEQRVLGTGESIEVVVVPHIQREDPQQKDEICTSTREPIRIAWFRPGMR